MQVHVCIILLFLVLPFSKNSNFTKYRMYIIMFVFLYTVVFFCGFLFPHWKGLHELSPKNPVFFSLVTLVLKSLVTALFRQVSSVHLTTSSRGNHVILRGHSVFYLWHLHIPWYSRVQPSYSTGLLFESSTNCEEFFKVSLSEKVTVKLTVTRNVLIRYSAFI